MIRFETALAQAQVGTGIISEDVAKAIVRGFRSLPPI